MPKDKPNEFTITRLYDAPVKLVWAAWTDPQRVGQWWGPRGFTLTTHSKDLRAGGHWKYTMHGPDGTDYPNHTNYHEVEECSRLVYDHGGYEDRPPLFRVTATFKEEKGKTRLTMTMTLESPEALAAIRKHIKQAGGEGTWDRLAEYLAEAHEGKDRFVINRSFQAPIATIFKLWTDPKHFSQWLPPTGFTMKFIRADISQGGSSFYSMTNGQVTMYGKVNYQEITPTSRLVYTQEFCDEKEGPGRHPMAPTFPPKMQTTVRFEAEDENTTRVTVEWEVAGEASKEERDTFHHAKGGMTMGWTGSFDKLDDYLPQL